MTRTSLKIRDHHSVKSSSRAYTRCERCRRPYSVYCRFGLYHICLKDLAHKDQIPGPKKTSW